MQTFSHCYKALDAYRGIERATAVRIQNTICAKPYYIVVGTLYGYLHTSSGDIRVMYSASNAYRVARNYRKMIANAGY